MNKYQFTVNGIVVDNPDGWKNFELRLKRDDDIAGLLVSATNKFTFSGTGYRIIKAEFDTNYNNKLEAKVFIFEDNGYVEKYKGVIILTDVLFNLEKKTAQTTIEDASFQGAIQGNKNIKAFLDSGFTKNNEAITPLTIYDIDYFNASGTYQTLADRRAFLLKDALSFMVRFMTDDEVKGVQSAYLDDTDNFDGSLLYITTGESIRLANSDAPNVSFSELITFLQKTHDLTFDFVTVSGDIVMRIEEREFFFQATSVDTFRDLTDLTVNVDAQRIASHLEIGNNSTATSGNCSITTRFFTFQKEDYSLTGKGNIDKLIDLTTDFVTDSNVIEFIVANLSNDTYDDDIVIVQGEYDSVSSKYLASKFKSTSYCSNLNMYNVGFTNDNIIARMIDSVPSSLVKYLTASSTLSKTTKGTWIYKRVYATPVGTIWPQRKELSFINTLFDPGSRYNTTPTTYYDVPFPGLYEFKTQVLFSFRFHIAEGAENTEYYAVVHWRIWMERVKANGNVVETVYSPWDEWVWDVNTEDVRPFNTGSGGTSSSKWYRLRNLSWSVTCNAGDRIRVKSDVTVTDINTGQNVLDIHEVIWEFENNYPQSKTKQSYFESLGTTSQPGGGMYKEFDPNSFKARLYKFQKNVSLQRTDNIRNNTRSSVIINELSDTSLDKTVWIEEMVNNVETSETSFTMIN